MAKPVPVGKEQEGPSQKQSFPLEMFQLLGKPLSEAHRRTGKMRVAPQ
jgi:hypothetical protein